MIITDDEIRKIRDSRAVTEDFRPLYNDCVRALGTEPITGMPMLPASKREARDRVASAWISFRESEQLRAQLASQITADLVRSAVLEACNALLDERKLYIVKPQHPTMNEIALEAYGHGRACDAVALQGVDLQAVFADIADRVAVKLIGGGQ